MNVGIYSYYNNDLNPDIAIYQKKVFDKFKIPITQIIGKSATYNGNFDYEDHPNALTDIIKKSKEDYIIFFDIDCIPLTADFYNIILKQIEDDNTLAGGIQCANHIDKNKSYVSPAFCGFSKKLYYDCGQPSFNTDRTIITGYDNMQRFTDVCLLSNKNIKYWNVTDSGNKKWNIDSHKTTFGNGTIYENMIYHQFEIRYVHNHKSFIEKCKSILNYE